MAQFTRNRVLFFGQSEILEQSSNTTAHKQNDYSDKQILLIYLSLQLNSASVSGVHGHDGAEVHGIHVLGRPGNHLLDNYPICLFSGMEWIPKRIELPVGA